MKASQLFWGFFFITIGSLYLVARYSAFIVDWYAIWELWPVLLILTGIGIIVKGTFVKPVISVLMGVLIAFLVFGFFNDLFDVFDNNNYHKRNSRNFSENNYELQYDNSINHVNLKINAGAGKFVIEDTTDILFKGYSEGNFGEYEFTNSQQDSNAWVNFSMDNVDLNMFGSSNINKFEISLNKNPTYSMDFNIGAAKSYFDLRPFKVKNLVLKTGAADTKIRLGNKSPLLFTNVEMGAAALKIYIPKTSGCKIYGDMVLIAKDLDGFMKHDSDYYITENYETAKEKIIIQIDGGVSSIDVKRN
jgi:energy-coupling factor transporter transmembrane protein EcfT